MFKAGLNQALSNQALSNQAVFNRVDKIVTGILKVGLPVFLLTQPVALLAGSDVTPEPELVVSESAAQTAVMTKKKSAVPPPPPGPYKSTALRDHPVERSVQRSSKKSQPRSGSQGESIGRFSPDRPWPDDLRPASSSHRQPDNRQAMRNSNGRNPAVQNPAAQRRVQPNPAVQNYPDYRQRPPMPMGAMSDPRGQSHSYSPGYSPNSQPGYQSNYPPGYRPNYGSSYQSGNNAQYKHPVNRMPYPAQGRP